MVDKTENIKDKLVNSLKGREAIYLFLSRIYEKEIDAETFRKYLESKNSFLGYSSIEELDPNVNEGFKQLYEYFSKVDEERIDEEILKLAVDYANLFLGVKYTRERKGIPHPSESVYMTGYMYQDERDDVFKMYLDEGLVKSEDFREPEDHIAIELYFMAYLCKKAISFLENEDYDSLLGNLMKQKRFLNKHLLKWAFKLANDVIEYADTKFYRATGKILKGFLNMEKNAINELIKQAGSLKSIRG